MGRFEHFGFGVPWEDLANYAQAVRAGDRLYVSGQLSHDPDGKFLHEGDIEGQTEVTLANLDVVLRHFGAERTDVVETNIFLVGLRANFAPAMAVCKRYFGDHRPASNAFGVVELALPEQLIEIAATAVLAPSAGRAAPA
jgi:enamine deaminase RidA (YjgF/YER057c/UK114 family)